MKSLNIRIFLLYFFFASRTKERRIVWTRVVNLNELIEILT